MQAKPRFVNWARIEDWTLVAWMAFATPVFARIQGTTSDFAGLSLPDVVSKAVAVMVAAAIVVVRIRWPRLSTTVRRALVAPFTLVAGIAPRRTNWRRAAQDDRRHMITYANRGSNHGR